MSLLVYRISRGLSNSPRAWSVQVVGSFFFLMFSEDKSVVLILTLISELQITGDNGRQIFE